MIQPGFDLVEFLPHRTPVIGQQGNLGHVRNPLRYLAYRQLNGIDMLPEYVLG